MNDANDSAKELAKRLGLKLASTELLSLALTHPSYSGVVRENNQRLEFLGDAVLGLLVAGLLYENYPDNPEGWLTERRAALVREESLADAARQMGLGGHLLLGKGAFESGDHDRNSVLADAFEAVLGAVYLTAGSDVARDLVLAWLRPLEPAGDKTVRDYKSRLQQRAAARNGLRVDYRVIDERGPDHDKTFVVALSIGGKLMATAEGKSKKQAEQAAAKKACRVLR